MYNPTKTELEELGFESEYNPNKYFFNIEGHNKYFMENKENNIIESEITKHFNIAIELAVRETERLAREVLKNNPEKVLSYTMANGTFFFCDRKNEIIHFGVGENESLLYSLNGYKELEDFIDKFDENFHITGESMTFTANGKLRSEW